MKSATKNLLKVALLILTILAAGFAGYSQNSDPDNEKIKSMIESRNYTFRAQAAIPQRGGTRYLSSEYDLNVSKDTITSFLPFFGRAYSAPIDPTKGGIKFTSTDFTYEVEKKKQGWDITITPKDARADVRYLVLSLSDDGYGTLRVISTNRDGISFSGYITSRKDN